MLDAAVKALSQMFSPPFRAVLLKSVGLALVLIVLIGIAVQRLLVWLATYGTDWAESVLGTSAHTPLAILAWIVSIAAGLGIIVGSIFLMPAVTALVGELLRRRHRARSGTHILSRRAGRQSAADRCAPCSKARRTRFVLGPGLSRWRCRSCSSPASASSFFSWPPLTCSAANISSWRPCAIARRPRPKRLRKTHQRHGLHRRHVHRRLRIDPDRQSRHAAVRHGVDGAHVQADDDRATTDHRSTMMRARPLSPRPCSLCSIAPHLVASFVTVTRTVPSASAITRSVLASNSTPARRRR